MPTAAPKKTAGSDDPELAVVNYEPRIFVLAWNSPPTGKPRPDGKMEVLKTERFQLVPGLNFIKASVLKKAGLDEDTAEAVGLGILDLATLPLRMVSQVVEITPNTFALSKWAGLPGTSARVKNLISQALADREKAA